MTRFKFGLKSAVSAALAGLLLLAGVAWQSALAQGAPRPAQLPPAQPAALSTTLSYYFISGATFNAGADPFPQNGCIVSGSRGTLYFAPVHLPQASVVVSMTLFTDDTVVTTTFSTAYFGYNDGQGNAGHLLSVDSVPGVIGYQHHQNLSGSPVTIDNQNNSYEVEWHQVPPDLFEYSLDLSLCGVRLAYYAPVGATFLPAIEK